MCNFSCNAFTLPEDTKYLILLLLYNGDCDKKLDGNTVCICMHTERRII